MFAYHRQVFTTARLRLHTVDAQLIVRDPAHMLARLRADWGGQRDLWVFGYASLIWRPEFDAAEHRSALVHGWHRALRMRSRINRGTPQQPGLVFALLPGGACRGVVYRLRREHAPTTNWSACGRARCPPASTTRAGCPAAPPHGVVPALAFTLSRRSDAYMGPLPDEQMLHILRHARGSYGTTLDYLADTAHALRQRRGARPRDRAPDAPGARRRTASSAGLPRPAALQSGLAASAAAAAEAGPAAASACRTASRSASVSTSTSTPGSSTSTATAG